MSKKRKTKRTPLYGKRPTGATLRSARGSANWGQAPLRLKYEAVENTPTRPKIYYSTKSEDRELDTRQRQTLLSEARDQLRNFSLAGFALRKHLQFVSYYRFSAHTDNQEFNLALENRVRQWSRRQNCDVAQRRSLDELLTIIESHRAVDGDVGILRRHDCRIQIIEGDRIRDPNDSDMNEDWVNGVKLDGDGRAIQYAIHRRKKDGGFEFDRRVPARDFDLLTYCSRADQVRGVSLLAPAVKMIAYLYRGIDYALAKLKLEQMLGLKTTFEDGGNFRQPQYNDAEFDDPQTIADKSREMFGDDLMHLALKVGEDASFMESNNPSQNFQAFVESVVRMIFAALDVPYSFYDGSKTNFYGSKGEFEQYLDTVEKKQQPTIAMLDDWLFDWLLPNWLSDVNDPLSKYLQIAYNTEALRATCGWRGSGFPSWRLFEYVKEIQLAVASGMASPYAVAESFGEDVERNIAEMARLRKLASGLGVDVPFGKESTTNVGL